MATLKICDKCKQEGVSGKFEFDYPITLIDCGRESLISERKKYDLCDKCAMEIALYVDPELKTKKIIRF